MCVSASGLNRDETHCARLVVSSYLHGCRRTLDETWFMVYVYGSRLIMLLVTFCDSFEAFIVNSLIYIN